MSEVGCFSELPAGVLTDVARRILAVSFEFMHVKCLFRLAHVSRAFYVVLMRSEELWSSVLDFGHIDSNDETYLAALIKGHLLLGNELPHTFHERFSPLVGWSCVAAPVSDSTHSALWAPSLKRMMHHFRNDNTVARRTSELDSCVVCSLRTCKCLLALCTGHRGTVCITCSSNSLRVEQRGIRRLRFKLCQRCGCVLCLQHDGCCCDVALQGRNEHWCQKCAGSSADYQGLESTRCVCGSAVVCEHHALGRCTRCGLVGKCSRCPDIDVMKCENANCRIAMCTRCDPGRRTITKCEGCGSNFCDSCCWKRGEHECSLFN
jgi:hypothetical protein